MRKPVFVHILRPLYSGIIFFFDHYCAGVSNKHCLLHLFFSFQLLRCRYKDVVFILQKMRLYGQVMLQIRNTVHWRWRCREKNGRKPAKIALYLVHS